MKIFLDTNIIIDVAQKREAFYEASSQVILFCNKNDNEAFIAWHSFSNLYYILGRLFDKNLALAFLHDLVSWVEFAPTAKALALSSLESPGRDLEDALQIQCAQAAQCDCIITRNPKDFALAEIPVYTPSDFLLSLE